MLVPQPALLALAAKYEALIKLRRARDDERGAAAVSPSTKLALRHLSEAYPGCLRELDRCSLSQLTQRLADVHAAAHNTLAAPWIAWMWRYHELLRMALHAKRGTPQSPAALASFLAACQTPPAGRLVPLVFEQLEREAHTPASHLRDTLFPPRRR